MGKVAQAAQDMQLAPAEPKRDIRDLLAKSWDRVEAVLPKHMSSERLYQLAVTAIKQTPELAACDTMSLVSCVMKCSALGLEPSAVDGLGRAYILPYRNHGQMTATFILGYRGMIDLARRSGEIKDISARAVFAGDEFEYEFGLDEKLVHRPSSEKRDPGAKPTHVYMVCHFKDGGHYIDVMTYEEVEAVRKRSKAANNGPWVTDYVAMAKKTVIRRAFPYLPASVEAQQAVAADETTPDYSGMIDPVIPDSEPEAAPAAMVEAEATVEPREEETGLREAVCKSCGSVTKVAPDSDIADLNGLPCCEKPNYEWRK